MRLEDANLDGLKGMPDVKYDFTVSSDLQAAFRAAASTLEGQRGSRSTLRSNALTDFWGYYSTLFESNGTTQLDDLDEIVTNLRLVADKVSEVDTAARAENNRRRHARRDICANLSPLCPRDRGTPKAQPWQHVALEGGAGMARVGAPPLPGFVQRQPHTGIRMTYGYIRVSSDKQTVENQRFEIKNFCKRQNMKVDGWIEETISGTKNYSKRRLGVLLKKVTKGDMIICSELSRLGRSLFMIMDILNICMNKECQVWTIKDNYRLGDDISSKVLAFAFGLSAEIERNLISQRTREALARRKAEGVVLGRPKGRKTAPEKHKLYPKRQLIVSLLNEGISKRRISVIVKVDRNTLSRYINANDLRPTVPSPTRADRISVQIITNAIASKHEHQ